MTNHEGRPVAKTEEVLSTRLSSGEIVVFDRKSNRAHALNPAAAAIWHGCDGQRTVGDLAELLSRETGTEPDPEVVRHSLAELERLELLERPAGGPRYGDLVTRREAFVRAGTRAAAAAAALPIIATVLAPTSASASSCRQTGVSCTAGSQCCSGVCAGGFCV
ncbi:MAG TPA: PqqD family peptide modification chaperone [Thermoanaerobaculia bacterium]|nr:PqqD family peptide modification chaperone [Thermoanaerobaculia bacterium]